MHNTMNFFKTSTLVITVAIIGLLINGCATQIVLKNRKSKIKPLGCASKGFPKSWHYDADSLPVATYEPSTIYVSMNKPILCIPFNNKQSLLLVGLSTEYLKILEEISNSPDDIAIKSISANILKRLALDNTKSDYFVLDIIFSKPVTLKPYNERRGPKVIKDKDGSVCFSFGTYKGGWSFPQTAKIEVLEYQNFSFHKWQSLFHNNKYKIDLKFHNTRQKRDYSNSLPKRILLTPFALVFDVITFPIQLLVGLAALS